MEDVSLVIGRWRGEPNHDFFGVFDGHGGKDVAEYVAGRLPAMLHDCLSGFNLKTAPIVTTDENGEDSSDTARGTDIMCSIRNTFSELNKEVLPWAPYAGTTVAVSMIMGRNIVSANCGDARIVMGTKTGEVNRLSHDHKPGNARERQRILQAGGFVSEDRRVNGILSVARAIGDGMLYPYVCPVPHVTIASLDGAELLVLACDGLWDVVSDEGAIEIARACSNPNEAAARLVAQAKILGSTDNVSVVVVYCDRS